METAKETSDQAKQAAERASEAAKPYYRQEQGGGAEGLRRRPRIAKELMDKSKSDAAEEELSAARSARVTPSPHLASMSLELRLAPTYGDGINLHCIGQANRGP